MTETARSRQYTSVGEPEHIDSFDAIYAREFEYVWRTLGRLGVPPSDIADAAHDVFVVMFKKRDEIDPARPLRPLLFGIARRIAAIARRKQRPESSPDAEVLVAAPPHAERDMLWQALAVLDDDRRAVFILHDLEGHTGPEIAAILEIPVNTVHSRLRLARAELVAALHRLRDAA
ncbi:MAG TPA: sigma-70 family RNA polymerase sigma factor [Kofleriaceae bacterium]